ncbi:Prohibitin-2, subunit of the prohibitin complex (Phb1p-Phb2p) [Perkinsus olseni]|uniref:Prohibitin n=1 Tax=Perkinsus olseni TaxID=32597 RepID=A0A7J6P0W9_PEROL|nr:Prohibitin-2, subunit of the prohibitin complex (Phb1p-Phb2p) [Perkinsus olseni]
MSQKFTEAFSKFGPQLAKVITVGSVGIGGSVWAFKNCLFNVDAGHRAIKFSRIGGLKEDLYTEGTHVSLDRLEGPPDGQHLSEHFAVPARIGCRLFTAMSVLDYDEKVVSRRIRQELVERAREFNLILDDVAIVDLAFSPEYAGAVEQKQVAQQQAEKAKYQVLKAQEMKKNIIIKAQGEMESAKMIGSAIQNNPGFVELRKK